jgi:hypothetical protein
MWHPSPQPGGGITIKVTGVPNLLSIYIARSIGVPIVNDEWTVVKIEIENLLRGVRNR